MSSSSRMHSRPSTKPDVIGRSVCSGLGEKRPSALCIHASTSDQRWYVFGFRGVGIERDLQHAVPLMAEEVECGLDVIEREMVRDERAEIDAAMVDHRHEPPHP